MPELKATFRLSVDDHVMIAHSLPHEFFGPAKQLHGATLAITATFERAGLDPHGVVLDIGLASTLLSETLEPLRYRNLDEHPYFEGKLSTTEVICHYIGTQVAEGLPPHHGIQSIEISAEENPQARASVRIDIAA